MYGRSPQSKLIPHAEQRECTDQEADAWSDPDQVSTKEPTIVISLAYGDMNEFPDKYESREQ
jgi:hypothetical protein